MGLLSPVSIAAAEHRHADTVLLGTALRRIYRGLTAAESDTNMDRTGYSYYIVGLSRAKKVVADVIATLDEDMVTVADELPTDYHTPQFHDDLRASVFGRKYSTEPDTLGSDVLGNE